MLLIWYQILPAYGWEAYLVVATYRETYSLDFRGFLFPCTCILPSFVACFMIAEKCPHAARICLPLGKNLQYLKGNTILSYEFRVPKSQVGFCSYVIQPSLVGKGIKDTNGSKCRVLCAKSFNFTLIVD